MTKITRRKFLGTSSKASLAGTAIFASGNSINNPMNNIFIHHVYFWLKNPASATDRDKLVAGLTKLAKVKTIKQSHIGKPANTKRDVIDSSYSVSWLLMFDTLADQESYQTDPVHLKFIEDCSQLWEKVKVYDSVDAVEK